MADSQVEDRAFGRAIITVGIIAVPLACVFCHVAFKMALDLRDVLIYEASLFGVHGGVWITKRIWGGDDAQ